MKTRAQVAFVLVVLVCLGAIGFFIVRNLRDGTPRSVAMTDGTTLYIRAVVYGTNTFATETPLKAWARRYLSPKFTSGWLEPWVMKYGPGDSNELRFFLVRKDANGKKLPDFWSKIETVDSNGFVYRESPGAGITGNNDLLEFSLRTFPHRDKKFLVRIYDTIGSLRAEFMVKNPMPSRSFPAWKPEHLPQTKTNGPVRFTLKGLRGYTNEYGMYYRPQFTIDAPEAGWRNGKKVYHSFSDATGNKSGSLSTNEPAWKMHVELFRPNASAFPSNLVWNVPISGLPTSLTYTNVGSSNTVDGIQIWLRALCGPVTLAISNYTNFSVKGPGYANSGWSSSEDGRNNRIETHAEAKPFALVETAAPGDETELVMRFRNAKGKVLKTNYQNWQQTIDPKRGPIRRYAIELLDTNSQPAALEIKVNRPLDFDFMVNPREVSYGKK